MQGLWTKIIVTHDLDHQHVDGRVGNGHVSILGGMNRTLIYVQQQFIHTFLLSRLKLLDVAGPWEHEDNDLQTG